MTRIARRYRSNRSSIFYSQVFHKLIQQRMSERTCGTTWVGLKVRLWWLIDGWHLLARMHIIERNYQSALGNDTSWAAMRDGLGMGQYDREAARSMSSEDWLLVVVSHATGFDFRAYFDVWAHKYSNEAATQVAALSLPSMPLNFYVSSGDGYCQGQGFDGNKLPLDGGGHVWPETGRSR